MRIRLALAAILAAACSDNTRHGGSGEHQWGTDATPAADADADGAPSPVPEARPPAPPREAGPTPEAAPPPVEKDAGPLYAKLLSETGLYSDVAAETLGQGVRQFQPAYALWSDGATKRRWVRLPTGEQIDTSNMDFWKYPVGTKAWKEFSVEGKRIETRMLHKTGAKPGDWTMIAYAWRADGSDADAVPEGQLAAAGTTHDIPRQEDCVTCHANMPGVLLGVTALQLSHDLPGLKLRQLVSERLLTKNPSGPITLPGGTAAQKALGYLHANCGNCHNSKSSVHVSIALTLWEETAALGTVEETTAYTTAVGQPNAFSTDLTIDPGYPQSSALVIRMNQRGQKQMPPLGSKKVDTNGVTLVSDWIRTLPPIHDAGAPDSGDGGDGGDGGGVADASADDGG